MTLDAPPVITEDTRELAADTGAEILERLEEEGAERKTPFVARAHARSPAREGERLELAVDTRELHFFDLETGGAIYA
jgi:multiple sugar transport system ATP-binding protein